MRENVLFALRHGRADGREAAVREMLALCRLGGLEARYPREISGGQRQRVAIARALASDPAVLLLDEPFAALDRETREEVMSELRGILRRTRVTAVLVTHDLLEAAQLGEELITMIDGMASGARATQPGAAPGAGLNPPPRSRSIG